MKEVAAWVVPLTVTGPIVTPVPLAATVVAPLTKFVPVRVITTVVPCVPDDGLMAVKVGTAGIPA